MGAAFLGLVASLMVLAVACAISSAVTSAVVNAVVSAIAVVVRIAVVFALDIDDVLPFTSIVASVATAAACFRVR